MGLKLSVTKDEYTALAEGVQALYEADGDNYKLAVEGLEDTGALRRAKDREAQAAREAKARADELEAELAEIRASKDDASKEALRKSKDIDALEKSWKDTADTRVAAEAAKAEKLREQMKSLLVGNVAQSIASELFVAPEIAVDFVAKRLAAEFDGDTPTTRVLDKSGQPSAATIDEFKKELLDNPSLKDILVGSKASGGGASNGGGSGGGAGAKQINEMSEAERVELYRTNPTEFHRLNAAKG